MIKGSNKDQKVCWYVMIRHSDDVMQYEDVRM